MDHALPMCLPDFQLLPDPCCSPLHLFSLAQTTQELKSLFYNFLPIHLSNERVVPGPGLYYSLQSTFPWPYSHKCAGQGLWQESGRGSQHWYWENPFNGQLSETHCKIPHEHLPAPHHTLETSPQCHKAPEYPALWKLIQALCLAWLQ